MSQTEPGLATSDEELIRNAQSGDQDAFAELWRRHYRSGARVARQFTSSLDADDLVSEAYARIYQRMLKGGGPTGAFRPYLYTTIRNLASTWGAKSRNVQVDDIADYEDPSTIDDPVAKALDLTLTARAFRSLPERWQSVLWYTEVEGMDPHEVAPILGMSANGVAALSYRARDGLRKAWLQAHVSNAGVSEACKWTIARLGAYSRHSLAARELNKLSEHLQTCAKCAIVSEEVDEVSSHLAMVLLPVMLGAGVGGILAASLSHAGSGTATAAASTLPAIPASFTTMVAPSAFAPPVAAGLAMGVATGAKALIVSVAVVGAIGASVALGLGAGASPASGAANSLPTAPPTATTSTRIGATKEAIGKLLDGVVGGASGGTGGLGSTVNGLASGGSNMVIGLTNRVVAPTVGALTPGASPMGQAAPGGAPVTTVVQLRGTGTPGAIVAAQAGGIVYGTAKVGTNGSWSLQINALPAGVNTLNLQQTLTLLGVTLPIDIPLTLDTGGLGLVIHLLN